MNTNQLKEFLNIASFTTHSKALGPGLRSVVWVQGCPLRCKGCIAPEWIPFRPAMMITAEELVEKILVDDIDGLTFSGGEPMEQAAELAAAARIARQKRDINIICFTGYQYERLLKNPPNRGVPELLVQVDVLIDGPFIQSLNDSVGLRGSSNQRAIHLTSRLRDYDFESHIRKVEVKITDGELAFVGIPTPAILSAMKRVL